MSTSINDFKTSARINVDTKIKIAPEIKNFFSFVFKNKL